MSDHDKWIRSHSEYRDRQDITEILLKMAFNIINLKTEYRGKLCNAECLFPFPQMFKV